MPRLTDLGLRSRFRRTGSAATVQRRPVAPPRPVGGFHGASQVLVALAFSGDLEHRKLPGQYATEDRLERWSAIQAGKLPRDVVLPPIMDEEAQRDAYYEAIEPLEAAHRARENSVRETAADEYAELMARARRLRERSEDEFDRRAEAAAEQLEDEARDVAATAARQLDYMKEDLDDERNREWAAIYTEAQRRIELHENEIEELQRGLDAEVRAVILGEWLSGTAAEVDSWSLM